MAECARWPDRARCTFAGASCETCERFESYAQAQSALARHRLLMLSGAGSLEEDRRRRVVRALLREIGARLDEDALDSAVEDAGAYVHGRCCDMLGIPIDAAVLEHGQHALELEAAWLREWVERWQAQRAGASHG